MNFQASDSDPRQPGVRISKPGEMNAKAVQQGEVEAAQLAVFIAVVAVVQDTAGFQRSPHPAHGEDGQLGVIVAFTVLHVGEVEQAGVVQNRVFALRHAVEAACRISQLAHVTLLSHLEKLLTDRGAGAPFWSWPAFGFDPADVLFSSR